MLIKRPDDISPSEITAPELFARRREFLKKAAFGSIAGAMMANGLLPAEVQAVQSLGKLGKGPYSALLGDDDKPTSYKDVTSYNNFYEFGTSKGDPSLYAHKLPTQPWSVSIEGLVKKPKTLAIEDLLKLAPLEERIYRLRCVEGWSMVIPWVGYPLSALLKQVEPLGSAKYVEFVSFYDQPIMASPFFGTLDWPYVEGLRMDEAMHPLTLLTLGLYGELLPKQNGAPVRVIVPWKYGFKSGKSIVKIRFVEEQPLTAWNKAAPREYGFYSNVNPNVDHPRWSQARERRIGEFLKRPTLMFNGYADQVGQLYTGMDLKRFY